MTERILPFARKASLNSFTNRTQFGFVVGHDAVPSTKAKPSKSKSMPSKFLFITKSIIDFITFARSLLLARSFARTNLSVPSVMVGIILKPALRIVVSGISIATLGFPGVYRSKIYGFLVLLFNFKVYQNGITSLIRSTFAIAVGSDVLIP